ncbi:hemolysin family protein [Jeotgalibacillus haloalkalitolerans]|uniref:Hemolysin family protein n=1 Tax=Jeotgalibacillus haloalkalitolerans TaxID=3104292 RepID=A0ABU5KPB7_9BACL|nr:hemolysin family protein [Jeotgalibacillus sp. HH7-29]MDZ5713108.1 hemolysin family protein [Jeotgalibacillus sp. HH7-29]
MEIDNLILVVVLLACTAFFVVSEFSIVKVRSTRIDQLLEEGHPKAANAKKVMDNLDEYLSACQLGITVSALALGWIGGPVIAAMIAPLFAGFDLSWTPALSFVLAFSLITFLHVVIGELSPKIIAIQQAERITLMFASPLIWFYRILYPFIRFLNGSARLLTGMFGLKHSSSNDAAHSEEELRMILSESLKSGEINQSEYKFVNKIFEFDERVAKEIMVPRTEIASVDSGLTLLEVFEVMKEEQYTRYPVTEDGDRDNIIGMINMKELMTAFIENQENGKRTVSEFTHPIIQVIDSIPIHELLHKFQRDRMHMGILLDEYGGTSGLVTMEDIIEEIVGEIQDEFDADEIPDVQQINEHHYILDSKVLVQSVNELLDIDIDEEDVDTIGGWFMTRNFNAEVGDEIYEQGHVFRVNDVEGYHILYLEVWKLSEEEVSEVETTPSPAVRTTEAL